MKLHLPKLLLTAVLAACVAPAAWGLSMTGTVGSEITSLGSSPISGYMAGFIVTYSVSGNDGTLSGFQIDGGFVTTTFDIDLDAAAAITGDKSHLVYVSNGSSKWGLRMHDGEYAENGVTYAQDGVSDIVGLWNDGMHKQAENAATLSELGYSADGGTSQSTTVTAKIGDKNPIGVALYKGSETTDANKVYQQGDLLTTTNSITSLVFNTALVSNISVSGLYSQVTVSNEGNTWSKVFDADKFTNITTTRVQLTGGDSGSVASNANPIVVGGSGQLHLEAWGEGNINLDDDIYLGSSTHTDAENFGVIRISNDDTTNHYTTVLSGNIYLVEDSSIKGTGSESITISGTLTDKAVPTTDGTADGDYTLTLGGGGIEISGKIDLGGLNIIQGYGSNNQYFAGATTISSTDATIGRLSIGTNATLSIAAGGKLTVSESLQISQTIQNQGTLSLDGATIIIDDSTTTGSYGYNKADNDVDGNGFLNGSFTVFTNSGDTASATTAIGGVTLYGIDQTSGTYSLSTDGTLTVGDTTTYWINNDTTAGNISSAIGEDSIVRVTAGKTYDVNGTNSYSKVVLESGATLANTGSAVGTSSNGCNEKQNYYLELVGDAKVSNTGHLAMVKESHLNSTLKLNGHTLTKEGSGTFTINSAIADAGTIAIAAGEVVLNEENDSYQSDLDEVAFTMASGTKLRNIDSVTIKSLSSAGGEITANSQLVVNGAIALTGGTTTLKANGQLKANDMTVSNGGTMTLETGAVLDLTGKYANGISGNNTQLTDIVNLVNSVTTADSAYVLINGSPVTDENASSGGNINMQKNLAITSAVNVVFANNLNINGKGWDTNGAFELTIGNGASLKVGETGTGQLALITEADLIINDASVTAGLLKLGHTDGTSSSPYEGTVTLNTATSSLTVEKVQFQGSNDNNALTMNNGTLEFTTEGEVFTGKTDTAKGTVSISGGEVVVNKDQKMTTATNRTVSLSNMAFSVAEGKTMELGDGVITAGTITGKGEGTLRFKGAAAMDKAVLEAGAKAIFEQGLTATAADLGESALMVATTVTDLTLTAGAGSALIKTSVVPTDLTSIAVDGSATLQAGGAEGGLGTGLVLLDSSTLTINGDGGVNLGGALTLGSGIELSEGLMEKIDALTEVNNELVLFTNVTSLTRYDASGIALMNDEAATSTSIDAADVFTNLAADTYTIDLSAGNVSITMLSVPEPTTATLSLLALAGLAARRRRK